MCWFFFCWITLGKELRRYAISGRYTEVVPRARSSCFKGEARLHQRLKMAYRAQKVQKVMVQPIVSSKHSTDFQRLAELVFLYNAHHYTCTVKCIFFPWLSFVTESDLQIPPKCKIVFSVDISPLNLFTIFFIQKSRVQVWLYGRGKLRIEGIIIVSWGYYICFRVDDGSFLTRALMSSWTW